LLKTGKKFQSEIRHKCTAYSSVKLESGRIALHGGDIALMIVQNAENPSVREGKMKLNGGVYAPKKHLYGCDGSSWAYV